MAEIDTSSVEAEPRHPIFIQDFIDIDAPFETLRTRFDGDIELAPVGRWSCRVSVDIIYTPPLGGFGARMDRALMHRVAASTVRSFISRIATKLRPEDGDWTADGDGSPEE